MIKKSISSSSGQPKKEVTNRLREIRIGKGFSQSTLAQTVGVTRQALYAIENNHYLPSTDVSLKLAKALSCAVEDLFALENNGEIVQADLVGHWPRDTSPVRAKLGWVGKRIIAMPLPSLGDQQNYHLAADGLILGHIQDGMHKNSVATQLWRGQREIKDQIVIAGCDPAMHLVEAHLHPRFGSPTVVGRTMGSLSALKALKQEEAHIAGIHIVDPVSGEYNLPFLKTHLKGKAFTVVRFAGWEQGFMVKEGNPKGVRTISDLEKRGIKFVNRESGAGARILVDRMVKKSGMLPGRIKGYDHVVHSHLDVSRLIAEGSVDVGIGVQSAARLFGLDFIPLQEERYDFVIPNSFFTAHSRISDFLDAIVSRPFRMEIEALGGYDTKETGKIIERE